MLSWALRGEVASSPFATLKRRKGRPISIRQANGCFDASAFAAPPLRLFPAVVTNPNPFFTNPYAVGPTPRRLIKWDRP
jgi:hypothetical protein